MGIKQIRFCDKCKRETPEIYQIFVHTGNTFNGVETDMDGITYELCVTCMGMLAKKFLNKMPFDLIRDAIKGF